MCGIKDALRYAQDKSAVRRPPPFGSSPQDKPFDSSQDISAALRCAQDKTVALHPKTKWG